MFKKLRNRMLLINMVMISTLILVSFSMIYFVMAGNTQRDIEQRLDRAISFMRMSREMSVDVPPIPHERPQKGDKDHFFEPIITLVLDKEGNITDRNSDMNIEEYIDESVLSAQAKKIVQKEKRAGNISMLSSYRWDYRCAKNPDGYIIAMGQFRAEHDYMLTLVIVFALAGLAVLAAVFFISLYSANRSIRPVEESYNRQKQFVEDASHELRTPLTTINTNIDVLLSHELIDEEKKWLCYIKDEIGRMNKLTNDLLYLARLDRNENEQFFRVSFSENVENVILSMEAVAFEKSVSINENIADGVYVTASDAQLKQLIMILLDNAIKYTPKNGNIEVVLSKEGVLRVKNSGEGISQEDIKHIFDRFYRSDKSRARESGGYGLGLSIAKAICVRLGASISVSSKQGEWTEFTVRLTPQ